VNKTVNPRRAEEILVRPADANDRAALLAFYAQFEPRPASLGLPPRTRVEGWLDRLISSPNFIALAEQTVVGHAVLCPEGESGEVAVFVHQDYRIQGIGRRLLSALVEQARRLQLRRVWGMTDLDNIPMLRLAHSVGFVIGDDPSMFHMDLEIVSEPVMAAPSSPLPKR
jgi:GNAT superfamily N-acetyltransferase